MCLGFMVHRLFSRMTLDHFNTLQVVPHLFYNKSMHLKLVCVVLGVAAGFSGLFLHCTTFSNYIFAKYT